MSDTVSANAPARRRRPLIAGSGLLLFVCLFLPTLRVCNEPMAPYEFPLDYHVYLGSALLAVMALVRSVRAARVLYALWYAGWLATLTAIIAIILSELGGENAALILVLMGIVFTVHLGIAFYRAGYNERGMWIGGIVHGVIALCWYILLGDGSDRLWGVYVGLAGSISLLVSCLFGFTSANAAYKEWRAATAQVPPARVVST